MVLKRSRETKTNLKRIEEFLIENELELYKPSINYEVLSNKISEVLTNWSGEDIFDEDEIDFLNNNYRRDFIIEEKGKKLFVLPIYLKEHPEIDSFIVFSKSGEISSLSSAPNVLMLDTIEDLFKYINDNQIADYELTEFNSMIQKKELDNKLLELVLEYSYSKARDLCGTKEEKDCIKRFIINK